MKSMKRLITRQGSPKTVYCWNVKTFQAGAKWLTRINKDKKFQFFLSNESITWKFNLSRAPWWGVQFEQLIGLTKHTLYIITGKANLKWAELEKILLDVEVNLNNRSDIHWRWYYTSIIDTKQYFIGRDVVLLTDEEVTTENEGKFLRKRQKSKS